MSSQPESAFTPPADAAQPSAAQRNPLPGVAQPLLGAAPPEGGDLSEEIAPEIVAAVERALEAPPVTTEAAIDLERARQRYRELLESWESEFPPVKDYLSLSRRERAPVDKAIIRIGAFVSRDDPAARAVREAREAGRDTSQAVLDLDVWDIIEAGEASVDLGIEVEAGMIAIAQNPGEMAEWSKRATSNQIGRAAAWLTQLVGEAERRLTS